MARRAAVKRPLASGKCPRPGRGAAPPRKHQNALAIRLAVG